MADVKKLAEVRPYSDQLLCKIPRCYGEVFLRYLTYSPHVLILDLVNTITMIMSIIIRPRSLAVQYARIRK